MKKQAEDLKPGDIDMSMEMQYNGYEKYHKR